MASIWVIEYKKPNMRGWRTWVDDRVLLYMVDRDTADSYMQGLARNEKHLKFRIREYVRKEPADER